MLLKTEIKHIKSNRLYPLNPPPTSLLSLSSQPIKKQVQYDDLL
jgi:hypothetical protein